MMFSSNDSLNAFHPSRIYVEILLNLGLDKAIPNVHTQIDMLTIDNQPVPITLNHEEYDNSYVCSPYTAYISYAQDELPLIQSKTQRRLFWGAIRLADKLLKWAKINQTLSINNWLVSTNLPPNWSNQSLQKLTADLIQRYPHHSFNIRSLNPYNHPQLIKNLKAQGWLMIPARQVYLFDNKDRQWWQRSHTKRDQKLLQKTHLQHLKPEEHQQADFTEIEHCFTQLFIEKHSSFNPQFTAAYLYQMHLKGLMRFHSFRDPKSQRIIASIGLFTQQEIITTPMVGYDTHLPKNLGLYRLLMAVLLKETYDSEKMMNLSSGAGNFKSARGGLPTIEYTAFYINHLSCKRKLIMLCFAKLLNKFAPKVFAENQI
ncbi:GNAT family N-acetyltransferase [Thiomicrorhabdus immobilis]|nr:GNAT family N-acetyltransferase [Thiomicrorhabdus immobilis]